MSGHRELITYLRLFVPFIGDHEKCLWVVKYFIIYTFLEAE